MKLFGKLFDKNESLLRRYRKMANSVREIHRELEKQTNQALFDQAEQLRIEVQKASSLDDYVEQAFAIACETAKRVLGLAPFDVQIVGALALHEGHVAEMRTGEGKTLVVTLPVFLNGMTGKGVHMVTVNDYLARFHAMWMAPLYKSLGLRIGVINSLNASFEVVWEHPDLQKEAVEKDLWVWPKGVDRETIEESEQNSEAAKAFSIRLEPVERRDVYQLDVVYGTNNEFGFDYLRDNLVYEQSAKSQRSHFFAIVDEVDSILIDEARTPLIISGPTKGTALVYNKFARIAPKYGADTDYVIDEKSRTVTLTEEGVAKSEKLLNLENLYDPANIDDLYHVINALNALHLYQREDHYIVDDQGQVVIVDEFTGRLMPGRRFSGGLHQALEAKEGVKVQEESLTYASITFQNYFRMYEKLAGMTGTAKTEEEEFKQIYRMDAAVIPTHKPMIRADHDDEIYRTVGEKYGAIIKEIQARYEKGQPLLVGTTSIEKSEWISTALKKLSIPHQVLNAKFHEQEAEIIAKAGEQKMVTIATNMAGRGTDIKLGRGVKELGGLYVIGTERHEARRIDNQLRGRSGRQGDVGESKFFLSTEDDLVRIFGGDRIAKIMDMMKIQQGEPIYHPMLTRLIEQAQKRVEGMHFSIRKYLLELDTVMDSQRKAIYEHRNWVLGETDISENLKDIYQDVVDRRIDTYCPGTEWDLPGLKGSLNPFPPIFDSIPWDAIQSVEQIQTDLYECMIQAYEAKKEEIGADFFGLQKYLLLKIIDERWRKHLESIDSLKEGISLRAYGQKDPVMEFKRESHRLFEEMIDSIYDDMASLLLRIVRVDHQQASQEAQQEVDRLKYTHEDFDSFNRKQRRKTEAKGSKTTAKRRMKVAR